MKAAAGRLVEVSSHIGPQSIANAIWAMGSLGFYHKPALASLVAHVKREPVDSSHASAGNHQDGVMAAMF